jgi:hypothetical protein
MGLNTTLAAIALSMISHACIAEVKELNNTEMTEAYVKDGAIVIKQKKIADINNKKLKYIVGPGKAAINEAQEVAIVSQNNSSQFSVINQAIIGGREAHKLVNNNLYQAAIGTQIPVAMSPAQQAQQQYAEDLVRSGLGLPDGTKITPAKMGEYLATFNGSTYGNASGAHQTVTPTGIQFIIPNLGGQLDIGIFPTGNNNINLETTNSQLILNLLFPQP